MDLEDIDIKKVIKYSGYSYFHFHRLFYSYMGETIKQYIKRLRLERAAHDIKYKKTSVTSVALDAGFNTPSSFNKAFKDFFYCSPSEYKKQKLTAQEYKMLEPIRIEVIKAIDVYRTRFVGPYSDVGAAFEKIMKWAYTNKIKNKKQLMGKEASCYGVYYDDPNITDDNNLRSDICISNTDNSVELDDGIERHQIIGGKYAVFLHKGEYSNLNETYNKIFSTYIKTNDIELRDTPIFERYLNKDPRRTKPENLKTEIYVPVT